MARVCACIKRAQVCLLQASWGLRCVAFERVALSRFACTVWGSQFLSRKFWFWCLHVSGYRKESQEIYKKGEISSGCEHLVMDELSKTVEVKPVSE